MSKNRKRAVAWIVLLVFSLVIFCSSAFIIIYADHDHNGEDCSICVALAECHKKIHTLGTAVSGPFTLILIPCILAAFCKVITVSHTAHTTLISLKVELLN